MNRLVLVLALVAARAAMPVLARGAQAQAPDSTRVQQLEPLVVTADRAPTPVATSTSAATVLEARDLSRRPVRTLAEAVQQAPGLAFVDFDGLGLDPQAMVRGFYGGGEADYLLLLLDGRPLTSLESGRIVWDLIPLAAVDRIEIVRGGASAAWGDAALGGVINVITKRQGRRALRGTLASGGYGVLQGTTSLADAWHGRDFSVSANFSRSDGFRTHADRWTGGGGGSLALIQKGERTVALSVLSDWRGVDEPGPLSAPALAESRTQVAPFFRFDRAGERLHRLGVEASARMGQARASGSLTGEYRHADLVRTLPLGPQFADTKNRVLTTTRLLGSGQLELDELPLPGADDLLLGFDASIGRVTSKYYGFLQGDAGAYAGATPTRGALEESGAGSRAALAGFVRYGLEVSPALRFSVGGRLDWLHDAFEPRAPSEGVSASATHVAFSPKVGVNFRYVSSARQHGHLYANLARSFKAPTPDELFDQRKIPVPFPPYAITFANAALKPQYGTSTEVGVYHDAAFVPGWLAADVTVAAYQLDLRDELDFDLQTFRYQNLGRSRHRGLEAGLNLHGPGTVGGFANYTLQSAISRLGDNAGKYLKAIPRHFVTAGMTVGSSTGLAGGVVVSSARRIYLDDANTRELPGWTRWDVRLAYAVRGVLLSAGVYNLWDTKYSTTGFPDAADPSVVYYYPAAGRTLQLGLSRDW